MFEHDPRQCGWEYIEDEGLSIFTYGQGQRLALRTSPGNCDFVGEYEACFLGEILPYFESDSPTEEN